MNSLLGNTADFWSVKASALISARDVSKQRNSTQNRISFRVLVPVVVIPVEQVIVQSSFRAHVAARLSRTKQYSDKSVAFECTNVFV